MMLISGPTSTQLLLHASAQSGNLLARGHKRVKATKGGCCMPGLCTGLLLMGAAWQECVQGCCSTIASTCCA